jgi:RHS repeat-associated protein
MHPNEVRIARYHLNFGYDDLSRLTSASGIYGTVNFSYDNNGNRQTHTHSMGTDTFSYVSNTNHLDAIGGSQTVNFDYDIQGNLIGRTFIAGGGPGSAELPQYTYTYDGQRVSKQLSTGTTVYHYDITGRLIAETNANGDLINAYVWLNGQPLAMVVAGGDIYYYHNDHLGTPQRMTDGNGTLVWAADYLPFGQADVTIAAVEIHLRFAGQYYDHETGLHYNYQRYYDPSLGRYLRADPIGLAGGINPYAYVQNNPVNFIDPYGLFWAEFGQGFSNYIEEYAWENGRTPPEPITPIVAGFSEWFKYKLSGKPFEFKPAMPWPVEYLLLPYLEKQRKKIGDWPLPDLNICPA